MFPKAPGIDVEDFPVPSQKSSNVQLFQKDIFDLSSNEHEDALAAESQDFILSRALNKYMTDWPGYIKKASEPLKRIWRCKRLTSVGMKAMVRAPTTANSLAKIGIGYIS